MSETINGITLLSAETGRALIADVQWFEPYTSAAFNRKMRGIVKPGFYAGFTPVLAGGLKIAITSAKEDGKRGAASVDIGDHQISVQQIEDVVFTLPTGVTTRVILEANYQQGVKTDQVDSKSNIQAVRLFLQDLSVTPDGNQLEVCRVSVPSGCTQLTEDMIDVTGRKLMQLGTEYSNDFDSDDEDKAATPKALKDGLAGKQPLDETLSELGGKSVEEILEYLGLGEGSALPVGVPVPWPSATPPTGWLKCNGAAFSAEEYPELAKAYPTNKLPDLRGEFIRGWDDGRGVDSSRGLLTSQDHLFASHGHWFDQYYALKSFDPTGGRFVVTADAFGELITANSISTVSVGGSETRPRNVAFNYIVRAA